MPTYEALPRFTNDHHRLTPQQRRAFRRAVTAFVDDLRTRGPFRAGLRIKACSAPPASSSSPGTAAGGRHGSTARR
ncbi:hypothetical protein GCM10010245_80430 [Streptomyces spectabilis]|nr:hypothetical protein GCM10010245_80430 [Streptomyces spectabilis]